MKSDMVVTFGLPLMAGLSLQQFAGILAHELGHCSQGAGLRVSWIVRSINFWFARTVYLRDQWDDFLVEASEETDFRIGWIFWLARMAVFFSRGVLWCFMMVSHAATCWLLRQMEFDADRYQVRLSGSEHFEATFMRVHWLTHGMQDFIRSRMLAPSTGRETGNPIRDFIQHCDSMSDQDEQRVRKRMLKAKTGLMDTHPCDSDRIASAKRENAEGVFSSDLPAEALVRNFDALCLGLMQV
ncbi:MAG: M48 family metalloprotease [Planctomycetaceae bacterium]